MAMREVGEQIDKMRICAAMGAEAMQEGSRDNMPVHIL